MLHAPPSTDLDVTVATFTQDGVSTIAIAEECGFSAVAALLKAAASNSSTTPLEQV